MLVHRGHLFFPASPPLPHAGVSLNGLLRGERRGEGKEREGKGDMSLYVCVFLFRVREGGGRGGEKIDSFLGGGGVLQL